MKRLHLFEFEDQTWCPRIIRELITDFLLGLYNALDIYKPAFEKIEEILDKTNTKTIVDCCSGSGGPIKQLQNYLDQTGKNGITITLTDKYPNTGLFDNLAAQYPNKIFAYNKSLDATKLPSSLQGMRTFFSSFHHFKPEMALKILQDAVHNNAPIGIFECTERKPADFFRVCMSPITALFMIPFAKRFTLPKFLLTYVIPVSSLVVAWDYFISVLRSYSSKEIQALINQLNAPGYKWEIGRLWSQKGKCYIPYFVGYKAE